MCEYLLTWLPKAQVTSIRTLQSQEFDSEDGIEARAQELVAEGAEQIRRWGYEGTFTVKVETYWKDYNPSYQA